jgi:hemerythrin-like domain-containing protein
MNPTVMLTHDHRLIERVLDCIERAAGELEAGRSVRPALFTELADFVRDFADGCHHRKEEEVLFPALERAGLSRTSGPLGVMLCEHDDGRRYAEAMRLAAERIETGEPYAAAELTHDARAYAVLMRQHIYKEDHVLFPLAERMLTPEQQAAVVAGFEALDCAREQAQAKVERLERELQIQSNEGRGPHATMRADG